MSDNLESYFRKYLKEETPGPEKWNVPSDNIWEKVQPEISKRKGIFIPWKYFYIFGIGLVLLISTLVFWPENKEDLLVNKNDVESRSIKADQIKITENVSGTTKEKETEKDIGNSGVEPTITQITSNEIVRESVPNSTTKDNNTNSEAGRSANNSGAGVNSGTDNSLLVDNVQQESSNNYPIIAATEVNEEEDGFAYNSSGNMNADEINEEATEANFFVYSTAIEQFPADQGYASLKGYDYLNTQKANSIPFSPGKFGVGAYYAPTYTSTEVKGLELPGNDQMGNVWLFSNNWGFDLYYYLSYRFTLVSGVGSSEIRSWSKTTSQFNYDPSTEHDMGNNQTANGMAQTSPTPFGTLSSEVVYSFSSDDNIPDGELMESVSETFQNIRYLSIPLGIEYNLLNQEKNLWFLETGINYNISMRDKTEFIPQILHEGEEMKIMESKITQGPNYENNYWGFYIGTGYKYPVASRVQLTGTVRYNRSITPLKSIGSATTNVQGYQLKVGVVYLLH